MQLKYWYRLILHRIICSQSLLTCNPQYFQGRIPFKFLQFLIILRRQSRKMALMSLNVFTTSHPLHQTSLYISCHWLLDRILEVEISLARWEVNPRWPSMIHTTEWIVLMKLGVNKAILLGYEQRLRAYGVTPLKMHPSAISYQNFEKYLPFGFWEAVLLTYFLLFEDYLSHVMRKPVYAICEQQRHGSACASAQSDQHLCCSLPI